MPVTQIPSVERVYSPRSLGGSHSNIVIDVKYRRVHTACPVIKRSRGGTRRIYHGAASTLLDTLLGILGYFKSIDRSKATMWRRVTGVPVARVERTEEAEWKIEEERESAFAAVHLCRNNPSSNQPYARVSLRVHTPSYLSSFFYIRFYDQLPPVIFNE